jgi:APA family basic amino acid/polyamine antiporter
VSEAAPDRHPRDRLRRELSLTDATLLCVASVIGSGIFLTPGRIAELLPSPGLIFAVWATGGLLSLAGALANAELGALFPHAGGDYVYLREAYHPIAGFLVGWLSFFVIFAGTIATLSAGFAEGLAGFFSLGPMATLAVAIGIIVAASLVNLLGVRAGARFNNIATGLKVAALVAFVGAGMLVGKGSLGNLLPPAANLGPVGLSAFGLALSPVLFSYLGWNATVYVASEIRDPRRNVPRSLLLGLALCTAVYLIVNAVYLYAIPVDAMRAQQNVGEAAARALFGNLGGRLVALFVLASILGTLNATILVGPRIAYAMALDGAFFGGVDRVHEAYRTPYVAIWVQAATAIALLLALRTFPSVLDYTTFAIVLATIADTTALYALRRRRPEMTRHYVAWGYPWVPALYIVANLGIAGVMLWGRPVECAIGLAVTASGLPFYAAFRARAAASGADGGDEERRG